MSCLGSFKFSQKALVEALLKALFEALFGTLFGTLFEVHSSTLKLSHACLSSLKMLVSTIYGQAHNIAFP